MENIKILTHKLTVGRYLSEEPIKIDVGEAAVAIASGGDHLVILYL